MWWLKGADGTAEGNSENGTHLLDSAAATEMKEQFEQQQQLVQQLKDLLRENEQQLRKKEQTLEESAAKLSKIKLQHKAKITQLTSQLQEVQKKIASSPEKQQTLDDEKIQEVSAVDSSRGKVLVLKKQLEDTRLMLDKRQQAMANNEQLVENMRLQLQERDQLIAQLKSEKAEANSNDGVEIQSSSEGGKLDADLKEMYAQIVYKDSKIMELDNRILELERNVIDLQEHVKEKEEVIQARNKAIQLMSEDLSRRGKVVVDQLDDTRDQMRVMQNNFASMEDEWKKEKIVLTEQFVASRTLLEKELADKEMSIANMTTSVSKLESVRFELSTRNAELQEKVVRLQDLLERANSKLEKNNDTNATSLQNELIHLREELQKKESVIVDLEQSVGGSAKSNNQKLLKLKAQQKSQIRALEVQIEEIKKESDSSHQVLQNRIVDLEEEKGNLQLKLVDFDELITSQGHQQKLLQELKEKLEQQSSDLDSHVKMISVLQKEKLDLIEKLTAREDYITDLELVKSAVVDELKALSDSKISLELKLVEIEESRDDAEKSKQALLAQIDNLKTEFTLDTHSLVEVEQEKLDLQKTNQELVNQISKMQQALNATQSEANKLKDDLNAMIEEIKSEKERLNVILQEKDEFLLKLHEELDQSSKSKLELISDLASSNELINQLTQELRLLKENENLEGKKMDNRVASLLEQLGEMETEINKLQVSCQESEIQLETLRREKDMSADEMNQWKEITIEKNREFEKILSEKDSAFAQANKQFQTIIKEKDDLANAVIVKEGQLTDALSKLSVFDENLNKMTGELQASQISISDLEANCQQLQLDIIDKTEQLNKMEITLKSKNSFCLQYQTDLDAAKVNLVEAQQKLCNLNESSRILEESNVLLQQAKEAANEKLATLQDELISVAEKLVASEQEVSHLHEELNNSRNTVKSLERRLQEEIDVARKNFESQILLANNEFDNALASKQEYINHLLSKLEVLQNEDDQHQIMIKHLEESVAQFKSELKVSVSQSEDLANKFSECGLRENLLLQDINTLKEENLRLLTEQENGVVAFENMQKELAKTKGELEKTSLNLEARHAEIEYSLSSLENLHLEVADMNSQLDLLNTEKLALANEKLNLDEELGIAHTRIQELSSELEASRTSNIDLEAKLSDFQQKYEECVNRHDNEVSQYSSSISHLDEKVAQLRSQLQIDEQKYRENVELLQLELQEKHSAVTDGNSSLALALENLNTLEQEKADLEAGNRNLQKSVERLQFFESEFHKSLEMTSTLETKIQHLSEEKSRLQDRLDRLMEYNQQIESDLASICESAKAAETEKEALLTELNQKVIELEVMMSEKDKRLAEYHLHLESHKTEMTNLASENDGLNTKLCEMQAELLKVREQWALLNEKVESLNSEQECIIKEHSLLLKNKEHTIQMLERQVAELKEYENKADEFAETANCHAREMQFLTDKISNLETTFEIVNEVARNRTVSISELNLKKVSLDKSYIDFIDQVVNIQREVCDKNVVLEDLCAVAKALQSKLDESLIQNQELNLKVQQMDEHVQGLQANSSDQVQNLSLQLDTANHEVQTLQAETLLLSQQLKDALEKMKEISGDLSENKLKICENEDVIQKLNDDLKVRLNELKNVAKENALLTERIEILEMDLADASKKVKGVESGVTHLKSEKLQLENCVHDLQHEKKQLQNQVQEQVVQIENLIIYNEDLKLKLSEFEVDTQELRVELQQKISFAESIQVSSLQEVQHLSEQLSAATAEITNLKSGISTVALLKEDLESMKRETSQLKEELLLKNAQIQEMDTQADEINSAFHLLQSELLIKEENISELNQTLLRNEKGLIKHGSSHVLKDMKQMLQNAELQLRFLKNENSSLQEQIKLKAEAEIKQATAYEAELTDLKENLRVIIEKKEELESSVKAFQSEIEMLQSQLCEDHQSVEYVSQLKTELQSILEAKQTLGVAYEESSNCKRQLEAQLSKLHEDLVRQKVEAELVVTQLNQEIVCLSSDKRSLESNSQSLMQKLQDGIFQNTELNQELQRVTGALVSVTQSNMELKSANQALQEEKLQLKFQLDSLLTGQKEPEKMLNSQQEFLKLEVDVKQLLDEKNLYQEQFQAITEDISKLNSENLRLEKLVKALQDDLQNATENHETTQLHLQQLKSENTELSTKYKGLMNEYHLLQKMEGVEQKQVKEMEPLSDDHQTKVLSLSTERLLGNSCENLDSLQSSMLPPVKHQSSLEDSPERQQLKNQLAVLQIKNEKMLAKLKIFKSKNDKLNISLNDMATMQQSLTDEKMRLLDFNKRAQDEIKHLSTELRNLERLWKTEVKMLQDRLDTVEVANGKLVEIKEDIEGKLIKQIHRNSDLQKEKEGAETEKELLENKHKEALEQLKLKRDQLQRQAESLQAHNKFLESDNLEFQHLIEKLQVEKSKFDHELKVQAEKYVPLLQEHNKLREILTDLQFQNVTEVADLKTNYNSLQKEYKDMLNIKAQLEMEVEELRTELDAAVKDRTRLERERDELRLTLEETRVTLKTDSGKSLEIISELQNLKSANVKLCTTIESLQSELDELRKDNKQCKDNLGDTAVLQESNRDDNDLINLEINLQDLKMQNADLLSRISTLEGEIWRLEEEKHQIIEEATTNEQLSVKKVQTDLEKVQLENARLSEELEALDMDLKNIESEKEQIEAESRLTFQQQQETIKSLRSQLLHMEEEMLSKQNIDHLKELQTELTLVKNEFEKKVLHLKTETEKATQMEFQNHMLNKKVTDLSNKTGALQTEKEALMVHIQGLQMEKVSLDQQLGHWKLQHQSKQVEERHPSNLQAEMLQRMVWPDERESNYCTEEEHQKLKTQVADLQVELEQTIHSLHVKDVRCEDLTSEITQLIEERDSLQLRLSSLLRADQQKEMRIKYLEMSSNRSGQLDIIDDDNKSNIQLNESIRLELDMEMLIKRLREGEVKCRELQQMNAVLEQALVAEREYRLKSAADLKFANEELAALGRGPKLKNQTVLSVDEEKVPLLPEHSQTLVRSYTGTTWRIANWIQGRRRYFQRTLKQKHPLQLLYYLYIFILHAVLVLLVF